MSDKRIAEITPNFAEYITPSKAKEIGDTRSIGELNHLAKSKAKCMVCNAPAWKYAGTGMCFSCTTGESDASEDYELVEEPVPPVSATESTHER